MTIFFRPLRSWWVLAGLALLCACLADDVLDRQGGRQGVFRGRVEVIRYVLGDGEVRHHCLVRALVGRVLGKLGGDRD